MEILVGRRFRKTTYGGESGRNRGLDSGLVGNMMIYSLVGDWNHGILLVFIYGSSVVFIMVNHWNNNIVWVVTGT